MSSLQQSDSGRGATEWPTCQCACPVVQDQARAIETLQVEAHRLGELLTTVSHDLRTPLTVIQGSLELAERATVPLEDRLDMLARARLQVTSMLSLTGQLVDRARSEPMGAVPDAQDLAALARIVCYGLEPAARLHHMRLELGPLPTGAFVAAQRCELERVLVNLVGNALKYAPPNHTVEIAVVAALPASWRVTVSDRGPGLPPDLQARVFERGARGTLGSTRQPSSGLGLWIVKSLVESVGGRCGYHPREGGGSVFWVELPVAGSRAAVTPQRDA